MSRPTRALVAVVMVLALTGCGADELSTTEACAEARGPVEAAMSDGDVAAAADVLRDVSERGDEDVRRIFGDAAEAADHIAENGNVNGVPEWATMAFGTLDETCGTAPAD